MHACFRPPSTKADMLSRLNNERAEFGLPPIQPAAARSWKRRGLIYTDHLGARRWRYHDTDVCVVRDGVALIDTGGWSTPSTRQKIMEALTSSSSLTFCCWGAYTKDKSTSVLLCGEHCIAFSRFAVVDLATGAGARTALDYLPEHSPERYRRRRNVA